jgi:hypothetical protein
MHAMHTGPLFLQVFLDAPNPIDNPFGWLAEGFARAVFFGRAPDQVARAVLDALFPAITQAPVTRGVSPVYDSALGKLAPDCGGRPDGCAFVAAWQGLLPIGYLFLGLALLLRVLRIAPQAGSRGASHVLLDVLPRVVVGGLAIPVSMHVLSDLGVLSLALANILCHVILGSFDIPDGVALAEMVGGGMALAPFLIAGLLVYVGLLVVLSRLALIVVTIAAPLAIPAALYRGEARLATTWVRMLGSGLAVPVVAAVGLAATLGAGVGLQKLSWQAPWIGQLLPSAVAIAGLVLVAIVTTAFFKDAVRQGMHGVKGSFEAVHLGTVARAPGEIRDQLREKVGLAAGAAASVATGNPLPLLMSAQAAQGGRGGRTDEDEVTRDPYGDELYVAYCAIRFGQDTDSARGTLAAMAPEQQQALKAEFLAQPIAREANRAKQERAA